MAGSVSLNYRLGNVNTSVISNGQLGHAGQVAAADVEDGTTVLLLQGAPNKGTLQRAALSASRAQSPVRDWPDTDYSKSTYCRSLS
jgi:hypothetical protein